MHARYNKFALLFLISVLHLPTGDLNTIFNKKDSVYIEFFKIPITISVTCLLDYFLKCEAVALALSWLPLRAMLSTPMH